MVSVERGEVWFAALYQELHGPVLRYALRRVSAHEADDVVSEVFTTAWRRRLEVDGIDLVWLLAVARHQVLHAQRAVARQARLKVAFASQPQLPVEDGIADGVERPIRRALARLSPADREVLLLSAWEDLSPAEIAGVVGVLVWRRTGATAPCTAAIRCRVDPTIARWGAAGAGEGNVMTDALERLRRADPRPHAVGYPPGQVEQKIAAIVGHAPDAARGDGGEASIAFEVSEPGRRPPRWRASLLAAAALVAVAGLAAGLAVAVPRRAAAPTGPAAGTESGSAWLAYSADGISFDRPAAWVPYPDQVMPSTMAFVVAYLATQRLPAPCTTSTDAGGGVVSTACGPPPVDLTRGGVFVDWTIVSGPEPDSLTHQPGTPTTIAGQRARVDATAVPPECAPTGAAHGVHAAIALPASRGAGILTMTACLGDPDPAPAIAAVHRMLNSLTFADTMPSTPAAAKPTAGQSTACAPACSASPSQPRAGTPVTASLPSAVPPPAAIAGTCVFPEAASGTVDGVVTVDEHPNGGVLIWYPPRNSTSCHAVLSTLDAPAASRLAHDIDTAPATAPGSVYNCGSGQGAAVAAFLTYSDRASAETVRIDLDGCSWLSAPDRQPRQPSRAVLSDLRPSSPPAWASYLPPSTH